MSPGEWVGAVRRAWMGMATTFLLIMAGAGALLLVVPPTYEAEAEIVFSAETDAAAFVPRTVATNAAVRARSDSVLAAVAADVDMRPDELSDAVSATWRIDTSITAVTVAHSDPRAASDAATAIADTVAEQVGVGVRAEVYEAAVPEAPVRPRVETTLAVGALVGLVGAVIYAASRFAFSRRLRSVEDAADLTRLPAYGWPRDEPTPEQMLELQLLTGAWAEDGRIISLVPVETAIDVSSLAGVLESGPAGVRVVRRPALQDSAPDTWALPEGPTVLVMQIGETRRRIVGLLGKVHSADASRMRGVIVLEGGKRRRPASAMSAPVNGERT